MDVPGAGIDRVRSFASQVRSARLQQRLPREELVRLAARHYGLIISAEALAQIESEERPPELAEALVLGDLLGVSLDRLISRGHPANETTEVTEARKRLSVALLEGRGLRSVGPESA